MFSCIPAADAHVASEARRQGVSWGFPGAFSPVSWCGLKYNKCRAGSWRILHRFLEMSIPEPPFGTLLWPPQRVLLLTVWKRRLCLPVLHSCPPCRSAIFPSCPSVISPPLLFQLSVLMETLLPACPFHASSPPFSIVSGDAFVQQTSLHVPYRYWQ